MIALALLLTGILLLGLLRRERRGVLGIGFESALVLVFYLVGIAMLFL
jgi:cation:H+ antiporter